MQFKYKTMYYRYISFILALVIAALSVSDTYFYRVAAEDVTTGIANFSFALESGAEYTDGQYIWMPADSVTGHQFVYRLSYAFIGEGYIEPGNIEISIPKHILKARNGYYADLCELPMTEISESTGGNEFAYYNSGDNIIITNIVRMPFTSEGIIDIAYSTTRTTFYYSDGVNSDTPCATMTLSDGENVLDTAEDVAPAISMDTSAKLVTTAKKAPSKRVDPEIEAWDRSWGVKPDDADEYYYLVWTFVSDISATQTYLFEIEDSFNEPDSEIVGYKLAGRSTFTNNPGSNRASYNMTFEKGHMDYVLTRHKKETYPDEHYVQRNAAVVTVTPMDEPENATSLAATAIFNYDKPEFLHPDKNYQARKYGNTSWKELFGYDWDIADYELTEFVAGERETISGDVKYCISVISSPYPYTLREEADPDDFEQYGKNPVDYILIDDRVYFNDEITTEMEEINIPDGTEPLTWEDYEIDYIYYYVKAKDARFNSEEMKFEEADPTYTDDDILYFDARFGAGDEWIEIGDYHLKTAALHYDEAYVKSMTNKKIEFQENCTAYRIRTSNAHYVTTMEVYPYYKVKRSEKILQKINSSMFGDEMAWLTNMGSFEIKKSSGESVWEKEFLGRDYFIGYRVNSSLTKRITSFENDNADKYATLSWKIDMEESYISNDGKHYIKQNTGIFYDLLPQGGEVNLSTVAVQTEGGYLDPSGYDVSSIVNYHDTGRTMLVVKIKDQFEYATLTFDLIYSWESVVDYGRMVLNSVAYETGNETITDGLPDNGGTISEGSLMSDIDAESDDEKFLYAEAGHPVDILITAVSGLTKTVKSDTDYLYSNAALVHQNGSYTYKLRYNSTGGIITDNLILFDSLENFSNNDVSSDWKGILQGADITQPALLGAAPVVYYSSISDLDITLHHDLDEEIDGNRVWKTEGDFGSIENAKALAVDLRKDTSGNNFSFADTDSIVVLLYMKAPPGDNSGVEDPKAYNGVYASYRTTDDIHYTQESFNDFGYTEVTLRIMADINIRKVSTKDNTTPIKGISFRLSGTSDYGTSVDKILMTDVDGKLSFTNVEKGTYILTETEGDDEYLPLEAPIVVVIDNNGSVSYDGAAVMEGTYYTIGDVPRLHSDITFYKRDMVYTSLFVDGARFELTGTSEYGNEVTLYAQSDNTGRVTFPNIELGTYTMRETNTGSNYIMDDNVYIVKVTDNNLYSISVSTAEGQGDNNLLGTGLNGVYSVYNEPYHEFTIQKEAYADGLPVAGAVFELKGTTASGNYVDISQTTRANGRITFSELESGVYTLQEVSAPYGFGLDPTVRTVTIDKNDHITISDADTDVNGFFVIVNKENGAVTITKKWLDGLTNDEREQNETDAVIHLTTEKKEQSAATFKNSATANESYLKSSGVVSNLNNVLAFRPFTGDDAEVQVLIDSGTAKRMDTEATAYSIYAWFISDTAAPDYGTVYWWSDAQNVYLQTNTWLLRGLPKCVTIDVSGLNTSKMTSFSSMFQSDESVTSLNLRSFDTSNAMSMNNMFYGCKKLVNVNLRRFDTSNVTTMANMFYECQALADLDLSSFDTSLVNTMSNMFYNCRTLTSLDLINFDTSEVREMQGMFQSCVSLTSVDVSSFDTSVTIYMNSMFQSCNLLPTLDLSNFDTSSVTTMSQMFAYCTVLSDLDISSFDTSSVTNMSGMFRECKAFRTLDLSHFDTSSVNTMEFMFYLCNGLTTLDLSSFDTSSVIDMHQMFQGCSALTSLNLSGFDTSSVNNMQQMFQSCSALTTLDLSSFDTSSVTNMLYMFNGCNHLTSLDVSSFDTSSAYNMAYMFQSCSALTTLDLSSFDTSSAYNMAYMFNGCSALTSLDLNGFDTSSAYNMEGMFSGCAALTSLNLSAFDTTSVYNMLSMFNGCTHLETLTFGSGFVTSSVVYMQNLFRNCYALTSLDLHTFDTSAVINMTYMFNSCRGLTSLDLSGFDTSNVTDMSNMFGGCTGLTALDLSDFNTSTVTTMEGMFSGCTGLTTLDISGFRTPLVTKMNSMFYNCYALTSLDVSEFRTPLVINMEAMFYNCQLLTAIDVSNFRTPLVTSMKNMFARCFALTDLDVSGFDTSNVINMESMFSGCNKVTVLDVSNFDTSNVTTMSSMFSDCNAVTVLDVSGFDTSNVTSMSYMFYGCKLVTELDVSEFDTALVNTMSCMFQGCNAVAALDVSNFDTSNVTSMSGMFQGCNAVTALDVSGFDTTCVNGMDSMFRECYGLTELDLSSFDTAAVNNTNNMFYMDRAIKKIYVSDSWNMNFVTASSNMFYQCNELFGEIGNHFPNANKEYAHVDTQDSPGNLCYRANPDHWVNDGARFRPCQNASTSFLSTVTAAGNIKAFAHYTGTDAQAQAIISSGAVRVDDFSTDHVIYAWNSNGTIYWWSDTDKVYLSGGSGNMFYDLTNITSINLTGIDTSHMTSMTNMFYNCQKLTSLTFGTGFDTSSVRSMRSMFQNCIALTALNVSSFDVSNVITMEKMFNNCSKLTTITLGSNFHAEKVRNMDNMFSSCTVLSTLNADGFYAQDIGNMYQMFNNCRAVKKVDLSHFSTAKLFNLELTFNECNALTEVPFSSSFVTPKVVTFQNMFYNCNKLTSLDMSSFYAPKATSMYRMFRNCSSLTELNLGNNFDASGCTTMREMFFNCYGLTSLDVSSFRPSSCTTMLEMFYNCYNLTELKLGSHFDTSNVTDMQEMFYNVQKVASLNIDGYFNTANVTNMWSMFSECRALTSLNVSGFDTSKVAFMQSMFYNCNKLTSLNVGSFNTSKTVSMEQMFRSCSGLTSLNISNFDTSRVVTMYGMFWNCPGLITLTLDNDRFDTSEVTNMMYMFYNCNKLTGLDVSGFDTGEVTNMQEMFYNCQKLTSLAVNAFDTKEVTTMYGMFYNCLGLTSLDLSSFDTGEVTTMVNMFVGCTGLTELDLSSFDTKEVTTMVSMFNGCTKLTNITFGSGFDTSEVTNMENMFYNCYALTDLDLSGFNTKEVIRMTSMFYNCKALTTLTLNSSFDTGEVTNMDSMFCNCNALQSLDLSSFDTKEVTVMSNMFSGCNALTTLTLSEKFNTKEVVYMNGMFANCYVLNPLDLSSFDTQSVTTMASMFSNCRALTELDLSGFVTPKVTTMSDMFNNCYSLESLDVSHFDTRKVTTMYRMFYECQKLQSLDLSSFYTPKLTNMYQMFYDCKELESLNVSNFDTTQVTTMESLFSRCNKIKSLDLSNFYTPKLTNMVCMFQYCYELESVDVSNMDTSRITSMSEVFRDCQKLTAIDIRNFNTYNVTNMSSMFLDCYALTDVDFTNFYTANVVNMQSMFNACSSITELDLSSFDTSGVKNMQYMFYNCPALKTIYVSNNWNTDLVTSSYRMFWENPNLVGQNGTRYDYRNADKSRAVIDTDETPGYLTYKAALVNNATDLVSTEDYCIIVKVTDSIWTYTFTGLNPNVQYYAWEEEIEDYISSNLIDSQLTVENLKGTITNRHQDYPDEDVEYGTLSIRKILRAENGAELTDADYDRMFVFTIRLTDENGDALSGTALYGAIPFVDGMATVRILGGMTAVFDYLPSGYHYNVTEEDTPNFTADFRNASGIIETDETARVICTNTKSAVGEKFNSFSLKKIVTGNYEIDADYLFTIAFVGLHPNETYTLSDDSTFETNNRGAATIDLTLRNGEEISVLNLPVGSSYKITEAAGDYISSYFITDAVETGNIIQPTDTNLTVNQSLSTTSEYVEQDEDITVTFTNTKDARQNVRLIKLMENASEDNFDVFTFTADFNGLSPNERIRTGLGMRIADDAGKLRFSFEMSANDELIFYDLPVGCTYQFIEAESEWVSSYRLANSGSAGTIVSESAVNDVNYKVLSTAVETVNEKEEVTVTFTNKKVQRDLTVTKLVDMPEGDLPYSEYSTQKFKYLVSLTGLEGGKAYEMEYTRRNISGIFDTGTFTASADGDADVTVFLTHGLSVRIKDLPEGATYTVTEYPVINYISSYEITGNEGAIIVKDSDRNRKTCRILSTENETVEDTELDVRVVFTNRYYDDPTARICMVQIEKEIDTRIEAFGTPTFLFRLHNTDTGVDFTCSVTLDGDSLSGTETVQVTKGHYTVEEVSVSRYSPDSAEFLSGTTASDLKINNEAVNIEESKSGGSMFSFNLDMTDGEPDSAYLKFSNKLTNYSGVSHNSFVRNHVA